MKELIKLAEEKGFEKPKAPFEYDEVYLYMLTKLQKWLRDEHDIYVVPDNYRNNNMWTCYVRYTFQDRFVQHQEYPKINRSVYEEALEKGLQTAVGLI